ncbi:MAG: DNA-binding protein, partial [Clostridium celatum]|nr:DNA-binding protein [Clostridium celatum]
MSKTKKEIKIIYGILLVFFTLFLALPFVMLLFKSLNFGDSIGITNYINAVTNEELIKSIINSIVVALFTAFISTVLGFILSYSINCSNISKPIKKVIEIGISIPMLLPTITYGFAIIYSFGKQGLLTKFFGRELLQIYGFNGLL